MLRCLADLRQWVTACQGKSVMWTEDRKGKFCFWWVAQLQRSRDEREWLGPVVLLPSSRFGNIPSDIPNIYLMINPPLAAGLSECCCLCSPCNPPGYLTGSDCSGAQVNTLPEGVIVPRNLFLKIVPFISISDCDLRYLSYYKMLFLCLHIYSLFFFFHFRY